jgi:phytoene dehydrogenase-like protein
VHKTVLQSSSELSYSSLTSTHGQDKTSLIITVRSIRHLPKLSGKPASPLQDKADYLWCELYFQSVHDATVAPAGQHTMSIFAQYVPYMFSSGTWDEWRQDGAEVLTAARKQSQTGANNRLSPIAIEFHFI